MTNSPSPSLEELRAKLAAIEHERWSDWQRWVHSQGDISGDNPMNLVLPEVTWKRWQRQIDTPYAELSDSEKYSDMEQVDRYWPLVEAYIAEHHNRLLTEIADATYLHHDRSLVNDTVTVNRLISFVESNRLKL